MVSAYCLRSTRRAHVRWQADFLAGDGSSPLAHLSTVCTTLRRQPQGQVLPVFGSLSLYGLCPAHLSREPPGHRDLPACASVEALPYGNHRSRLTQHLGQRQPHPGLASLRRFCPASHPYGTASSHRPGPRSGCCARGLRAGLFHHRSLPDAIPLGSFPQNQVGHQTAYAAGSPCPHPGIHPYFRRQAP